MRLVTRSIVGAALLSLTLPVGSSWATVQMLTEAKKAGMPAKNCQYCHGSTLPTLNERGQWLASEKKKQSAQAVDVDWLKTYPGDKKP